MARARTYDAYLSIDGNKIKGDSTAEGFKDWIVIEGFSHTIAQARGGQGVGHGGLAGGRPDHSEFKFFKRLDLATAELAKALNKGAPLGKIEFVLRRSADGMKEYMRYTFEDCIISGLRSQIGDPEGGGQGSEETQDPMPFEELTIRYNKITWDFKLLDNKGQQKGQAKSSYNIGEGKV
jgi:type VI secretion system secreted protein Hcp